MQVCQSAEDYQGYDGELGLCICREPPARASFCAPGRCRGGQVSELTLKCLSSGEVQLLWSHDEQVSSGRIKEVHTWGKKGKQEKGKPKRIFLPSSARKQFFIGHKTALECRTNQPCFSGFGTQVQTLRMLKRITWMLQ